MERTRTRAELEFIGGKEKKLDDMVNRMHINVNHMAATPTKRKQ